MAVLSQTELDRVARWFQRDRNMGQAAFTKTDLKAAATAADSWVDTNSAAYNAALPAAFRTSATTAQKSLLLLYVVARRFGFNPIDGGD